MPLVFRFGFRAWPFSPLMRCQGMTLSHSHSLIHLPATFERTRSSVLTACEHSIQDMSPSKILAQFMYHLRNFSQWPWHGGIPSPLLTPFTDEKKKLLLREIFTNLWNFMQNKSYNLVSEPAFSASKAHTFSIIPQSMFLKVKGATLISSLWYN